MKKQFIIITILFILSLVTSYAQNAGEFSVPLSDPNKRGKLKAHLNYGSITVKGSPRKDVLIKYKTVEESDRENDEEDDKDDDRRLKPLARINTQTNNDKLLKFTNF